MSDMNEILIYFIGQDNGLFKNLFEKTKEIIHKSKNGEIKILEGKKLKLAKNDNKIQKEIKLYKKINIPMKGLKYSELSRENIFDIYENIKSNKNKKNIIIRFENTMIKESCLPEK